MKRRDMKLLLEERFERIALLETRIDTMDQLVEGYRAREQAIFDTLQAAKESAAKIVEQAKAESAQLREQAEATLTEADGIRAKAREEAETLLSDAISTANTLKQEAQRQGVELNATVKADSERMLRDAEIIKREYEEMVDSFNAMLEQNASELEITASRFAEFVKNRKIDRTEARLDGNAFYKSVGELSDSNLPDASGDPSLLMQNIYRIQNRPLPEDRQETASQQPEQPTERLTAEPDETNEQKAVFIPEPVFEPEMEQEKTSVFPIEDGSGADERQGEPFSEAAWVNQSQQSEAEPQAEFTKAFDDKFIKSDYNVQSEACNVTQQDVESAFDALLTEGAEGAANAAQIPKASTQVVQSLPTEQKDDAVRAFDEYFDEAFEPSGKTALDEVPQKDWQGPEGALPEGDVTPGEQEKPATSPEPFSEQAWAQNAFASGLEPQAEGTLFDDASDLNIEPIRQTDPSSPVATAAPASVSGEDIDSALDEYLAGVSPILPLESYIARYSAPQEAVPVEIASSSEAERELDDYLAQMNAITPTVGVSAQSAPSPAPYSESAWSQSAFASEHEPQAEGALFTDANEQAAEPASVSDAERELNDYLAQISSITTPAVGVSAQSTPSPAPYSESAWSQSAFASEHEPQAEGALFTDANEQAAEPVSASETEREVDDYLAKIDTFATAKTIVAPEVDATEAAPARASAADVSSEIDDYFANIPSFTPDKPIYATEAPAPYSEQAWSHQAVSEYEPQAEGASFLSNIEPEEEPEPAPAPRKYNDYGEIREWEPEPEPEMEDIPTVSRYVGQSNSDEISLDDLLDEIIKAGD